MRKLFAPVIAVLLLAGCADAPQTQTYLTVACQLDKLGPTIVKAATAIAQIADPTIVDELAAANEADAVAHTAVQAACSAVLPGSVPTAVMPTLVPVGAPPGAVVTP